MAAPKYCCWKTRNQGYAEHRGRRTYFPGDYDSQESRAAYERWLGQIHLVESGSPGITLEQLAAAYEVHCEQRFGKSVGHLRTTACNMLAVREAVFCDDFGWRPAAAFSPRMLRRVIDCMVAAKLSRKTINDRIGRIKTWFRWAAEQELVPASTWHGLLAVRTLSPGRSQAIEHPRRLPAEWANVEPVFAHLSAALQQMLWLHYYTGCRSSNVCEARPRQFVPLDNGLLEWRPERHKGQWREHELVLFVGPQCQEKIAPALERPRDAYCWPTRTGCYKHWTYRQALRRAQKAAGVPLWTPHQLRHARATVIRDGFGVEAAQAALGHESLAATSIYAQRSRSLAEQIALQIG